ncbi:HAD family hydrolase [Halomicroarcula sp. GCM10025709]|uniref:HAD family hydrolase n=1 Tax=Haloarcula TaxID=2237 RepID=UPI0024C3C10E|nr:HAD-IA family hydrolase [Halomicroarcula sp. YJ-61-S]
MNPSDQRPATEAGENGAAKTDRPVVLFDMDGVFLEGRGTDDAVHERALDDALAERGLDVDPDIRALLSGHEYDTDFALGCRRLGVDPVALYERRERYSTQRAIDSLDAGSRTPYDDVEVLTDLADQYPLGVVSNNYDDVVRFVVDRYGIDVFDHVRGRATGVTGFYRRKPDPHYLLDAMDALDGSGGIYVGDRGTDVLAATRAGLDAAFVTRPHNEGAELPVSPAIEADSLTDLVDKLLDDWDPPARDR